MLFSGFDLHWDVVCLQAKRELHQRIDERFGRMTESNDEFNYRIRKHLFLIDMSVELLDDNGNPTGIRYVRTDHLPVGQYTPGLRESRSNQHTSPSEPFRQLPFHSKPDHAP